MIQVTSAGCAREEENFVLMPRDWLPASELAECAEAKMWRRNVFSDCANSNLLVVSDGSEGLRDTHQSLRQVAVGVATFSLQSLSDTSRASAHRFLGRPVARRPQTC